MLRSLVGSEMCIRDRTKKKEGVARLKMLEDLIPVAQKLSLDRVELSDLQKREKKLAVDRKKHTDSIPGLEDELAAAQDQERHASELKSHADKMHTLVIEISAAKDILAQSGGDATGQEQLTNDELDEVREHIKSLEEKIEEYEKTQRDQQHRLDQLERTYRTAQSSLSQLEVQHANLGSLRDRVEANRGREAVLATEIQSQRSQVKPLKAQYIELQRKHQVLKSEVAASQGSASALLDELRADVRKCSELKKELEGFSENPSEDVTELELQVQKMGSTQDKLKADLTHKKQKRDEQNGKKLKLQEIIQILKDNIRLHEKMKTVKEAENRVEKIKEDIERRTGNLAAVLQEGLTLEDLESTVTSMRAECHKIEGETLECKNQMAHHSDMLSRPNYKNIDARVMEKNVETKTTHMAVRDLQRYHTALDKALMRYHSMKMAEINKTLTDLWQTTYQGHDIDTVQLKHDDESTSTKRNYNYRLVMLKGGVEMDMRGRCSAGQKVLAGLVLRLALAETFGTQCGVLALDEPTTNLDSANIEAFAESLCRIIDDRRRQHNFQLIVITHDEDFVATLSKYQCHADHFYRVTKDENHHSVIEQCAMIDLG
eukprot:TRINITY_DN17735_c0_g1_i3.p1 TRINITY_DN17735_c0_g1~~TRINITY_DN17735_c0_g1_i3.p1  ORF type:complete len:603 (+),score=156.70 TRINITY_DN17735_c0_g1_i3:161-1969(+)